MGVDSNYHACDGNHYFSLWATHLESRFCFAWRVDYSDMVHSIYLLVFVLYLARFDTGKEKGSLWLVKLSEQNLTELYLFKILDSFLPRINSIKTGELLSKMGLSFLQFLDYCFIQHAILLALFYIYKIVVNTYTYKYIRCWLYWKLHNYGKKFDEKAKMDGKKLVSVYVFRDYTIGFSGDGENNKNQYRTLEGNLRQLSSFDHYCLGCKSVIDPMMRRVFWRENQSVISVIVEELIIWIFKNSYSSNIFRGLRKYRISQDYYILNTINL